MTASAYLPHGTRPELPQVHCHTIPPDPDPTPVPSPPERPPGEPAPDVVPPNEPGPEIDPTSPPGPDIVPPAVPGDTPVAHRFSLMGYRHETIVHRRRDRAVGRRVQRP